jgi:hypothetical protein
MDRNLHPKWVPRCPRRVPLVDQYSWPQKDTNYYRCVDNGKAHPIYDCQGNISFSLPLDQYPPTNGFHPDVVSQRKQWQADMRRYTPHPNSIWG